jgi:hypothetical protein
VCRIFALKRNGVPSTMFDRLGEVVGGSNQILYKGYIAANP